MQRRFVQKLRAEKREEQEHKKKFAPSGGTLAGQHHKMEISREYTGTIKKLKPTKFKRLKYLKYH